MAFFMVCREHIYNEQDCPLMILLDRGDKCTKLKKTLKYLSQGNWFQKIVDVFIYNFI